MRPVRREDVHVGVAVAVGDVVVAALVHGEVRGAVERRAAELGRVLVGAAEDVQEFAAGTEALDGVIADVRATDRAVRRHRDPVRHREVAVTPPAQVAALPIEDQHGTHTASQDENFVVRVHGHAGDVAEGPADRPLRPVIEDVQPDCRGGRHGLMPAARVSAGRVGTAGRGLGGETTDRTDSHRGPPVRGRPMLAPRHVAAPPAPTTGRYAPHPQTPLPPLDDAANRPLRLLPSGGYRAWLQEGSESTPVAKPRVDLADLSREDALRQGS